MKYKIRASRSYDLITSCCKKVRNQLKWEFDTKDKDYSESLIKIAIEVYNKEVFGYENKPVFTIDMDNGTKLEPEAIQLYDKINGTNYYEAYAKQDRTLSFDKSNDYATGTRDFGDDIKTFDSKISTCKNTFDLKKFKDLEHNYICQMNTYKWLYSTPELYLVNSLMSKPFHEIERIASAERYFNPKINDIEGDELQFKYEDMYSYTEFNGYKDEDRQSVREVPILEDFEETLTLCVTKMNKFITEKLEQV